MSVARYHRVDPSYWMLSKGWDDRTTVVGLYVQTCKHRHTEGYFHLPKEYMAVDLAYSPAVISKAIELLKNVGLAQYDEASGVLFLPQALEIQAPTTDKQVKGAMNRIRMVPSSPLLWAFYRVSILHSNALAESMAMEFPHLVSRNGTSPFESSSTSQSSSTSGVQS